MRMQPAYFEVTEPMRVLVAVGCSDGNAWIGSSRVIDTRYEARNARPGAIIHSLPGGTYLQDPDGTLHEARLRRPKPPLEKSHGGTYTDDRRLDDMLAAGRLRTAPRPATSDYTAAQARGRVRLPPLRGGTLVVEESAELASFKADTAGIAAVLAGDGAGIRYEDLGEGDAVLMTVSYPGEAEGAIISRSAITLETWVHGRLPDGSPQADALAEVSGKGCYGREAFAAIAESLSAPRAGLAP